MARHSVDRLSWLPREPSANSEAQDSGWFSGLRDRRRGEKTKEQASSPEDEFIKSIGKADVVGMLTSLGIGTNLGVLVKSLDDQTGDTVRIRSC